MLILNEERDGAHPYWCPRVIYVFHSMLRHRGLNGAAPLRSHINTSHQSFRPCSLPWQGRRGRRGRLGVYVRRYVSSNILILVVPDVELCLNNSRFVDPDMVMRLSGGGVGHRSTSSCNKTLRRDIPAADAVRQDLKGVLAKGLQKNLTSGHLLIQSGIAKPLAVCFTSSDSFLGFRFLLRHTCDPSVRPQ